MWSMWRHKQLSLSRLLGGKGPSENSWNKKARRGLGHRDRFTDSRGRKLSPVRDFQSPMDIRFWMVMDDPEVLLK